MLALYLQIKPLTEIFKKTLIFKNCAKTTVVAHQ